MGYRPVLGLDIGSINIPGKIGKDKWEKCWLEAMERSSVFGVQENFRPRQRRTFRRLAKHYGWGKRGLKSPNPVFWDKAVWEYVSHRVIKIHDASGRKDHPGFNDARYLTEVVLRHKVFDVEVAVLNTHWVAPFWVGRRFLRDSRRKSKQRARDLIQMHQSFGRIVIFMGDTNIGRKINLGLVWMRGKGIDKMGIAVPNGWTLAQARAVLFPAPSDHKHGVKGIATLYRTVA